MRLLCVSDIHGYADALDAVLEEATDRTWDQLVVCGDICFPGPEPLRVWRTLVSNNALCVQGLTDDSSELRVRAYDGTPTADRGDR